ncbi:MAG: DNA-processing protein DprA [Actinomycetes bacterium]
MGRVAAPGTPPARLAAVLRVHAAHGGASALLRAARDVADAGEAAAPAAVLDAAVARCAPPALPATTGDLDARVAGWVDAWARLGVVVSCVGDPGHPPALAAGWPHDGAPTWLARRGDARTLDADVRRVALVGARRASGYGRGVAAWLAGAAADAGVAVVSGGALGVDAAAHDAAADAAGGTVVVLGCGHDVPYPRPHAEPGGLFDRVRAGGGALLSEQPPDVPAHPGVVRARNRIVAGLVDAVVVVEGGGRSGALVTAGHAADLGVPVLAVPGDVRAPGSVAPHRLLGEGAAPCTGPADLLAAVGAATPATPDVRPGAPPGVLPPALWRVLADAWPRPVPLDVLAERAGLAVGPLLAAVTRGRVAGLVAEGSDGVRLARAP